jgi:hypothetical protein
MEQLGAQHSVLILQPFVNSRECGALIHRNQAARRFTSRVDNVVISADVLNTAGVPFTGEPEGQRVLLAVVNQHHGI